MKVICYHADVCRHSEKEICSMSKVHESSGSWEQKFKGIPFYYGYCPHKIKSTSGITDRRRYVRLFEPFYIIMMRDYFRRKKHEDMEM
jgi:hypothetical protein